MAYIPVQKSKFQSVENKKKALNKGEERGVEFKVEMKNTWKVLFRKLKGKSNHLESSAQLGQ